MDVNNTTVCKLNYLAFYIETLLVDYKFVLIENNGNRIWYSLTCLDIGLYIFLFEAVSIIRKPEKQMSRRKIGIV